MHPEGQEPPRRAEGYLTLSNATDARICVDIEGYNARMSIWHVAVHTDAEAPIPASLTERQLEGSGKVVRPNQAVGGATEVGRLLGVGRSKVFAMVAAGQLPAIRIGRSVRIPREALERWVREQTIEVVERNDAVIPMDVRLRLDRRAKRLQESP